MKKPNNEIANLSKSHVVESQEDHEFSSSEEDVSILFTPQCHFNFQQNHFFFCWSRRVR